MSEGQWRGPDDYDCSRLAELAAVKGAPFGRRCGWCGVTLRWWQLNLCQLCGPAVREPVVRSSPCSSRSRWDADPDGYTRGVWLLQFLLALLVVVLLGLVLR